MDSAHYPHYNGHMSTRTPPSSYYRTIRVGEPFERHPSKVYVFALSDGTPEGVHYIGHSVDPARTLKDLSHGFTASAPAAPWLRYVTHEKGGLHLHILEACLSSDAGDVTRAWMEAYFRFGYVILNDRERYEREYAREPWKRPVQPLPGGLERVQ